MACFPSNGGGTAGAEDADADAATLGTELGFAVGAADAVFAGVFDALADAADGAVDVESPHPTRAMEAREVAMSRRIMRRRYRESRASSRGTSTRVRLESAFDDPSDAGFEVAVDPGCNDLIERPCSSEIQSSSRGRRARVRWW